MNKIETSTWKTKKYEYDNINFMSQGEVTFYKNIKETDLEFEYQPEPITIIQKFKDFAGKWYYQMSYEPDFIISINKKTKIFIEIKGQNDNVFIFRKGQKPQIKNNTELYALRHKVISRVFTKKKQYFLVVRDNQLKTPEYAGQFWDNDLTRLRSYKKQNKKDLCAKVPRILQRINMIIKNEKAKEQARINTPNSEL